MTTFATLSEQDRNVRLLEAADRLDLPPIIVEKDFWVCWVLGRLFFDEALSPHLVFKGGTSLSKAFGAIQRFSEDVDLSVSPSLLGWDEADLDSAPSRSMRGKRFAKLENECIRRVGGDIQRTLEKSIRAILGSPPDGQHWLGYEIDGTSNSPVLVFAYPSAVHSRSDYIQRAVKLEFGSLTEAEDTINAK